MRDVLIVLAVLGTIIGGLFYFGLVYWGWFVVGLIVLLAAAEGITRWRSGRTLSQRMWALRGARPVVFWIVWAGMALAFVLLMVHLAWKAI